MIRTDCRRGLGGNKWNKTSSVRWRRTARNGRCRREVFERYSQRDVPGRCCFSRWRREKPQNRPKNDVRVFKAVETTWTG